MYFTIQQADLVKDYQIKLIFQDGKSGIIDLSSYVNEDNVFRKFRDKSFFDAFRVEYGTLAWGNGEIDMAPEHLYYLATGVDVLSEQEPEAI
jgi:hypothetical protein